MQLTFDRARPEDAPAIAAIRIAAAEHLTAKFGKGPWSWAATIDSVERSMRTPLVIVARSDNCVLATFRLQTRKPWAITLDAFVPVRRALYLVDMAVDPEVQRQGVGRACLDEAARRATAWPATSIRLDAYDSPAGASGFYERCGYRNVGRSHFRGIALRYFERVLEDGLADERAVGDTVVTRPGVPETSVHERVVDERTIDRLAVDERTVDERTVDERTVDERSADERSAGVRSAGVRSADERAPNRRSRDDLDEREAR